MLRTRLQRTTVVVVALAALALTASGVPDNKGTDAAIGWWSFVSLALLFLALAATASLRAIRNRGHRADPALR